MKIPDGCVFLTIVGKSLLYEASPLSAAFELMTR